ncbi:Fic family protein [Streptacidiphilus melanogenes]|uniref:Fic family protein n=1 Tax=Streptacidiphilus melanogenes TaxID=411235 RepID=UPI0005A76736|nr:Fic family protein [Streptacidiphilus melanogenes]
MFELAPGRLSWDEVDPTRHPFDGSAAEHVIRSLGPARRVPRRPDVRFADPVMAAWTSDTAKPWADAMSHALVERYGRWTVGWRWSHDEGDFDGGPIGNWCCPRDSVTNPQETLPRVLAALLEWRGWLEDLAGSFDAYPLDLASAVENRILWELAARKLILQVADRTGGGSGWHRHCRQVLGWFLNRWGVASDVAEGLVAEAVGGRFRSWSGPDAVTVEEVAERLARTLPAPDEAPVTAMSRATAGAAPLDPPDHLRRWLAVREEVAWHDAPDSGTTPGEPLIPARDGAAEDIRAFDGALDPVRAQGLLTALESVRADAARGATLDFETLRRWQRHVLGTPATEPPPFRALPAFAKGGRERYGIDADTHARLDACLAESAPDAAGLKQPLPLTARAARACLDVCFFHPFDDGNARAAFLTVVFVLAREGVTLDSVTLLRRVSFRADSPQDALSLARYVGLHLAETRRSIGRGESGSNRL